MLKILKKEQYIISKKENMFELLKITKQHPDVARKDLLKLANTIVKGSYAHQLIDDTKTIGLVTNGFRYNSSELGNKIIISPKNNEYWIEACLNVPLYKEYDKTFHRKEQNPQHFIDWIYSCYNPKDIKHLGMMARRYFEIIHPELGMPKKLRLSRKNIIPLSAFNSKQEKDNKIPNEVWELMRILKNIPREDREILQRFNKEDIDRLIEQIS